MKTAPMAGKSWQPSHEPHAVRGTGTHHTVETVERLSGFFTRLLQNKFSVLDYGTLF